MTDIYRRLENLKPAETSGVTLPDFMQQAYDAMDDDLNTPMVIAVLFEAGKIINQAADGAVALSAENIKNLKEFFDTFLIDILGIRIESKGADKGTAAYAYAGAVDLLMDIRKNAKAAKDWATSDLIRDRLAALGFDVKDTKNGVEWKLL